jgi:hypothetical protein
VGGLRRADLAAVTQPPAAGSGDGGTEHAAEAPGSAQHS